jgi:general secretion pathway protein F/type IV pilus assembly protein PilC
MPYYSYKMLQPSGAIANSVARLPYDDETMAINYLENEGGTVLHIRQLGKLAAKYAEFTRFGLRKVKTTEVAETLSNLSVMLGSGIPASEALQEAAQGTENPALALAMEDIRFYVEAGSSISEAVGLYPKIFSNTVLYLLRIGEETGRIDRALEVAATHLQRIEQIKSDTKQAMLYPSFILVTMGAAVIFWFYYVVPQIVTLFTEMEVELPPLTKALIAISEWVQAYLVVVLITLAALYISAKIAYAKIYKFRRFMQGLALKIPIIGRLQHTSNLAFVSEYLHLLLDAGVDAFKSLDMVSRSLNNAIYQERVAKIHERITQGQSVADAFQSVTLFPSYVVRMVSVGERTGTLPAQFKRVSAEYRKRLNYKVETLSKSLEPIILIIAGGIFGIILGGLFLPIYDLIGGHIG